MRYAITICKWALKLINFLYRAINSKANNKQFNKILSFFKPIRSKYNIGDLCLH